MNYFITILGLFLIFVLTGQAAPNNEGEVPAPFNDTVGAVVDGIFSAIGWPEEDDDD